MCPEVKHGARGEKWTFEIKFDGYRCIAVKRGPEVTLFSRHQKVLNNIFQVLRPLSPRLMATFVLDGDWSL
ncbi:MAG: hypothetical protein WCD63_09825 [Terrimicrobiaceae bacterium]